MSNFQNDYRRLERKLTLIEEFNKVRDMHADEDLNEIRSKLENLKNISDNDQLVKDFLWCVKMIESYFELVDPSYKFYWEKKMAEH